MFAVVSPKPENFNISPVFNLVKFVPTSCVPPMLDTVIPVATFSAEVRLNNISLLLDVESEPE